MEAQPGRARSNPASSSVVHVCTVQLFQYSHQDACYLSPTVAGASILQNHRLTAPYQEYSLLIYSAAKTPICGCQIHPSTCPAPQMSPDALLIPSVPLHVPASLFYFVCTASDSAVFKDQNGQTWSIRFPSPAHLETFVKYLLLAQVLMAKETEDVVLGDVGKNKKRRGNTYFTQVADIIPSLDNVRGTTFGDIVTFNLTSWILPADTPFKLPKEARHLNKKLKLKLRRSKHHSDMVPRGLEGGIFGMNLKRTRLIALLVAREKNIHPQSLHGRLGLHAEGLYIFKVELLRVQSEEEKKVIEAENKEKEMEAKIASLENYIKVLEDNLEEARDTADHLLGKRIEELSVKELSDLEELLEQSHKKVLEAKIETRMREEVERKNECILCCDRTKDLVFVPCGHWCCCSECGPKVSECPLCRVRITHKVLLFEA